MGEGTDHRLANRSPFIVLTARRFRGDARVQPRAPGVLAAIAHSPTPFPRARP